MPSSSSSVQSLSAEDARLRSAMERSSVKFHIKAGSSKWACTLQDRATYERQKAARTNSSSSSISTGSSTPATVS